MDNGKVYPVQLFKSCKGTNKHCFYCKCNSNCRYAEIPRMKNVGWVPFPKPKTNMEKCERWIRACGRDNFTVDKDMKTYLMMLYVTIEQEKALKKFCLENGWPFHKLDLNSLTEQIGPPAVLKSRQLETSSTDKRLKSELALYRERSPQTGSEDKANHFVSVGANIEDDKDYADASELSKRKTESGRKRKTRHQRLETHSRSLTSSTVRKSARLSKRGKVAGTLLSARMLKRKWNEHEAHETDLSCSRITKDEAISSYTQDHKKGTLKEELGSYSVNSKISEQTDCKENFQDSETWESVPNENSKVNVKDIDEFICSICHFHAEDKLDLENHYKTEHFVTFKLEKIGSQRTCSVCHKVFISQKSFKNHMERHETENGGEKVVQPFGCCLCEENFAMFSEYKKHLKKEHEESCAINQMYMCDFCGKIFKRSDYLKEHRDVFHLGVPKRKKNGKDLICEICGSNFKRKSHLNEHIAVKHDNSGVGKHACTHCSKTFHRPYLLEYHVNRDHLHIKPYECDKCKSKFFSKVTLKNHKRCCDMSEDSMITCEHCGKKIKTIHNYKLHLQAVHSDPALVCACGKVVRWQSSVTKHKRRCPLNAANLGEKFSEEVHNAKNLEDFVSKNKDSVGETVQETDKGSFDVSEDDHEIKEKNDNNICDLQEVTSQVESQADAQMIFTDKNEVNEMNPDAVRSALDVSHVDDHIFADLVNGANEEVVEISSTTSLGAPIFEDRVTGNVFYVIMKK